MKRAKRLVALVTIASLTFATASVVFAAGEAATDETTAVAAEEEAAEEEVAAEEAVAEPVAAEEEAVEEAPVKEVKVYDPLTVTEKSYYNDRAEDLGLYPIVTGMADLNAKIFEALYSDYSKYEVRGVDSDHYQKNLFEVSYTVDDTNNRYSILTVVFSHKDATTSLLPVDVKNVYYIDKEDYSEMTEAEFTAALAALEAEAALVEEEAAAEEEAVAEEEAAAEAIMVPLRLHAESLGYELGYDAETKSVTISKGDFVTSIVTDKNSYTIDGEKVELEAAPANQDGSIYVPVSFFEKVLGATAVADKDGNITFTQAAAAVTEATADTEPAADTEAAE